MVSRRLKLLSVLILLAVALGCIGSYLAVYRQTMSRTIMITPMVTTAVITETIVTASRAPSGIRTDGSRIINQHLQSTESYGINGQAQLAKEYRQFLAMKVTSSFIAADVTTGTKTATSTLVTTSTSTSTATTTTTWTVLTTTGLTSTMTTTQTSSTTTTITTGTTSTFTSYSPTIITRTTTTAISTYKTTTTTTTTSTENLRLQLVSTNTITVTAVMTATPQRARCVVAAVAYGSQLAPVVQFLRQVRDGLVTRSFSGAQFMKTFHEFYYSFSPRVAEISDNAPLLQNFLRAFLYPLITSLSVAARVFTFLPQASEVTVVLMGAIASALVGLTYVLPPAILVMEIHARDHK